MKKLLVILPDSLLSPIGGAGYRYRELLKRLKGFEIQVFCLGESGEYEGIKVQGYKMLNFQTELATNRMSYNLGRLDFKPDLVLCSDHPTIPSAIACASTHDAKLILDFNLAMFAYALEVNKELSPNLLRVVADIYERERSGAEMSQKVLTCSEAYKNALPFNCQAEAIQNGIDIEPYTKETEPWKFEGGHAKNIIYLGRISTQKGLSFLLDNGLELPEDTALHFVGGEGASDQFQIMLKKCEKLPRRYYAGELKGEDKVRILKSADAVIFPSISEPFGLVGLEAFAARTPLITSRKEGISDYCAEDMCIPCEVTARRWKPEDIEEWQKDPRIWMDKETFYQAPMNEWMEHNAKEDLYKQSLKSVNEAIQLWRRSSLESLNAMTEKAFQRAKEFSWEKPAEKLQGILEAL